MTLETSDWKAVAREFCQANNSLDVALVEKAIKHGATIAVQAATERVAQSLNQLKEQRRKANAPQ